MKRFLMAAAVFAAAIAGATRADEAEAKAVVDKVQSYKQQVVDGKLTVPTVGK